MKAPKGLGKGLKALISEADSIDEPKASSAELEVALIDPNPFQPRQVFDETAIEDLKQSIIEQGVLQPILVRPVGDRYQIIVGERRWRASKAAGLTHIPAQVRQVETDEEMLELAILENVQREDLNPIELARAIQQLQTSCNLTQEQIAQKLGVSRAHVANTLRLLQLSEKIQQALEAGKLTAGHSRALLSVQDEKERDELFERFIVDGKLTVRTAEAMTRKTKAPRKKGKQSEDLFPDDRRRAQEIARIEDLLRRQLATRVKIKPKGRGGVLEIPFYTSEDLERLMEIFERSV
jgi:ParB family transcriptional regulator, chromosome partitioning protein